MLSRPKSQAANAATFDIDFRNIVKTKESPKNFEINTSETQQTNKEQQQQLSDSQQWDNPTHKEAMRRMQAGKHVTVI